MARVLRGRLRSSGFVEGTKRWRCALIRRKDSSTWGIPKGFIDPGDSAEQAALNEAVEEAGVKGHIIGTVIGAYDYEKRGAPFTVAVYLLEVMEKQKDWREMRFRERRWFSLEEAALLLASHPVRPLWDRIRETVRRLASPDGR